MKPTEARSNLISSLVDRGYVRSKAVIEAMADVPREFFVPESEQRFAYEDRPLPIGFGQTISAPHMVAIMTELLDVREDSRILEVGAGSGYQAAVLSRIAKRGFVYTVERVPELAEAAGRNLSRCGIENVSIVRGDGTLGYRENAPYDRVIVTAAAPKIPLELVEQLADVGLMLVPVGGRWSQDLVRIMKHGGKVTFEDHGGCVFVPLIGRDGWQE